MELREFIKLTLQQVALGLEDAKEAVSDFNGVVVNPDSDKQTVKFSVSLTNATEEKSKTGFGVFLGGISLGAQSQAGAASESLARVEFEVPMYLPSGT